ncbi:MAG: permease-like cell division protein FtsX [Patescibacteria group bacterium]|nr:MAG: permease-like cell division protein FtsX [Patescibacteria group bacterium]
MSFWRSGVVSVSSILVMVVALSMIGSTILIGAFMSATLQSVQDKIDINVYFTTDAPEEEILSLKESLVRLPEVKSVVYVSREQALLDFRKRHENDQLTLDALSELDENPLRAVLNVKAKEPSQYSGIAQFLEREDALFLGGATIIDKVNYSDNKVVIERLTTIIGGVERMGFVVTIILVLISIFITFNTIRLVIYISREEIAVMKLVGADAKYIRGPFIVGGVIYGVIAALLTVALFYPATSWIKNATGDFYGGIDLFKYYVTNFNQIFFIILASGIALGAISSFLAVRRYLRT